MPHYFNSIERREAFKAIAESWIGTPYLHMACEKGRGADCTKFIGACLVEAGFMTQLKPHEYYPKDWMIHGEDEILIASFNQHVADYCGCGFEFEFTEFEKADIWAEPDPFPDLYFGDVIGFATKSTGLTNHTAIYMDYDEMIHCANGVGVIRAQLRDFWRKQMTCMWRVCTPEVEE